MNLEHVPIFRDLTDTERATLRAQAAVRHLAVGEVLCYAGDPADSLLLLATDKCLLTRAEHRPLLARAGTLIDPIATLGGLPHRIRCEAVTACEVLMWPISDLWQSPTWSAAARRYLAESLHTLSDRLTELEQPVNYVPDSAELTPGPFMFDGVTLIFAFCDADLAPVRAKLPPDLRLFRRPGRQRDSLLIALAHFPAAYPEDDPTAWFGYTETTIFVPARYRGSVGLFVPYIYPSAYEPMLLGREIYGFPKRMGRTIFAPNQATLQVTSRTLGTSAYADLRWTGSEGTDEPRLVRALFDWLGVEGRSAEVAFRAGDVLRQTMRLPAHRRIGVFNHKRVLAAETRADAPVYAVNQLTKAIFGVLRWYQIARLRDPVLTVYTGPLAACDVTLREAYRTQLDMRLTRGRVVRDYNQNQSDKPKDKKR